MFGTLIKYGVNFVIFKQCEENVEKKKNNLEKKLCLTIGTFDPFLNKNQTQTQLFLYAGKVIIFLFSLL